nr:EAL domain-containing protein [bacterium]
AQKSGAPVFISDASKKQYAKEYDIRPYMKSYVIIPIVFEHKSYGNIVLCFKELKDFTDEDKSLCTVLGNAMAQAMTINGLYSYLKDFKNTLDNTLDSIFIFHPRTLKTQYVNQGAGALTGNKRAEIIGKTLYQIFDGLSEQELRRKMDEIIQNDDLQFLVFESYFKDNKRGRLPVEISLQHVVQKGKPDQFLAIVRDITERKQSEDIIKKMAYYDALTGLPNRTLFSERLGEELKRAQSKKGMFGVLFIDLDRFKVINDIYGHQVGDQLLRQVAQRLQRALPKKATISRMGGDEFTVLIPKIKAIDEVLKYARAIQDNFVDYFEVLEQEVYVNCSVGLSVYPVDGEDVRTLLKHADIALHRAKEQGGSTYQQYNKGLPVFYSMQPKLERQLRQAIKKNELLIHYQPMVSVKTKRIVSCEALVRWNHPEMGMLYPDAFIGPAEESGLIVHIGGWILNEVSRQIKEWNDQGLKVPSVSVNVSPRELLRPMFVENVDKTLREHGIKSSEIKLELTETFLMKNIELSVGILEQLKLKGLKILIDDFGTGYASLNYLKRLPIDGVKIDRSFIQGSGSNLEDAAITAAIITIAHQLGLEVVAEGVELQQQLDMLTEHHCDTAQGNYFHKPMAGKDFGKLLPKSKK